MSLFLLLIGLIGFILFFYGIDLRYLGFLPIIFLALLISYHGLTSAIKIKGSEVLEKYSLSIAWIIILIGFVGVLNFFDVQLISICIILIGINLLLQIGSYLAKYKDGESVFQLGYYLSIIFLLIVSATFDGFKGFLDVFSILRIFNFAAMGFIAFIVGLCHETKKYMFYKLFVLGIGTVILTIINQIPNIYLALSISTVLFTIIFSLIFKIVQYKPKHKDNKGNISVRRILAGERITEPKKYFNSKMIEKIYDFIHNMPNATKQSLEIINILLICTVTLNYILSGQVFTSVNQFLYRIIIAFFIGNVLVLKKIGLNSLIQNLFVFLVINFAIYLSLFSYFDGDIGSVVSRGIIWNLISSILIFYAPKFMSHIFNRRDYIYRTISVIIAMLINVVLLIKTDISGQLIFFLILLYLGIQGMILFYALKYAIKLNQLQPMEIKI